MSNDQLIAWLRGERVKAEDSMKAARVAENRDLADDAELDEAFYNGMFDAYTLTLRRLGAAS